MARDDQVRRTVALAQTDLARLEAVARVEKRSLSAQMSLFVQIGLDEYEREQHQHQQEAFSDVQVAEA